MPWDFSPEMLERQGGPKLAWQLVRPRDTAKVGVVLIHGYGEYAQRYRQVVESWQERGIATLAFDLRGHNESGGRRGHIERWAEYVDDVFAVMDRAEQDADWKDLAPHVLFGHSLGGLIAVHAALREPKRIGALVLSSPFIGMSLEVPAVKRGLGVVMSHVWPALAMPTGLLGEQVTRDPEIAAAFDKDPLTVRTATARWYTETRAAQAAAERDAGNLACSIYCVQAGDDVIASAAASKRLFDAAASRDKRFELVPKARHEILQDLDRTAWAEKLGSVILSFRPVRRHAKTDEY